MNNKRQDIIRHKQRTSSYGRFLRPWLEIVVAACLIALFFQEAAVQLSGSGGTGVHFPGERYQAPGRSAEKLPILYAEIKRSVATQKKKPSISGAEQSGAALCVYSPKSPFVREVPAKVRPYEERTFMRPVAFRLR